MLFTCSDVVEVFIRSVWCVWMILWQEIKSFSVCDCIMTHKRHEWEWEYEVCGEPSTNFLCWCSYFWSWLHLIMIMSCAWNKKNKLRHRLLMDGRRRIYVRFESYQTWSRWWLRLLLLLFSTISTQHGESHRRVFTRKFQCGLKAIQFKSNATRENTKKRIIRIESVQTQCNLQNENRLSAS